MPFVFEEVQRVCSIAKALVLEHDVHLAIQVQVGTRRKTRIEFRSAVHQEANIDETLTIKIHQQRVVLVAIP